MRALRWERMVGGVCVLLLAACSESGTSSPIVGATADIGSGQVSSNQSGTIGTPLGAKITVPMYAVPLTTSGANGTMTFSIEKDTANSVSAPSGETLGGSYRFGPDGFTFAAPVRITIPVGDVPSGQRVNLYRVDPTTGAMIRYPSEYDPATKTVSAMTSQFSLYPYTFGSANSTADGAIRLINTSSNSWLSGCVDTYTLSFPYANPQFGQASAAPGGTIGWNSTIIWGLPQGTYRICCQMAAAGTISSPPGSPSFWYVNNVTVGTASVYPNYQTSQDLTYGSPPAGATAGSCPCKPLPTPSVGTGQVQVTLTWHSTLAVDLDLYVTDPAGNTVYYGNTSVASGGTLDRDNKCSNYENSRPENIFWTTAPTGQYTVVVKWFSACSSNLSSMPFELRVVNKTVVNTYQGTITSSSGSAGVEVTRFTVR